MTIITTKEQILFLLGNAVKLLNLKVGLYAMQIQVQMQAMFNVRARARFKCNVHMGPTLCVFFSKMAESSCFALPLTNYKQFFYE